MVDVRTAVRAYERWLGEQLGRRLVRADLEHKHKLMRKEAFAFLRGTCFRWAETAPELCRT